MEQSASKAKRDCIPGNCPDVIAELKKNIEGHQIYIELNYKSKITYKSIIIVVDRGLA